MKDIKELLNMSLLGIVKALILGLPVMLLWNLLMTDIFNLIEITYLQAIGVYLLSNGLFKRDEIYKYKNK